MAGPWRTKRLLFRAIETEDEPFLASISSDADAFMNAAPFIPIPQGKTAATKFREWVTSQLVGVLICLPPPVSDPAVVPAAAGDTTTQPIPIGIVNLNTDDPRNLHHRRSEIGIHIVRAYQGQGYGSEAIKWALRFGFRHCNLHRIEIAGFAYNPGALKLYERLGFKLEARKRDWIWHDGAYHDFVGLGMLEDEWRELYGEDVE